MIPIGAFPTVGNLIYYKFWIWSLETSVLFEWNPVCVLRSLTWVSIGFALLYCWTVGIWMVMLALWFCDAIECGLWWRCDRQLFSKLCIWQKLFALFTPKSRTLGVWGTRPLVVLPKWCLILLLSCCTICDNVYWCLYCEWVSQLYLSMHRRFCWNLYSLQLKISCHALQSLLCFIGQRSACIISDVQYSIKFPLQ